MRILKGVVGVVGTLALLAGLHHIVVVNARGTAFSNAFAGTCAWCHGDRYEEFGQAARPSSPFGVNTNADPAIDFDVSMGHNIGD